jgi:6-pyruvoyltetrahydropterin/6-carboxytetrahydropterin synthase
MITLTRVYRFAASHRLHSLQLSDRENAAIFGKCNNPYGHGHDYVLSVTVSGQINEQTGLLVSRSSLDQLIQEKVLHLFSHRNINLDVPQFANLVPTTENVALVIADLLQQSWREYAALREVRLERVHIQETDRNGFEVLMPVCRTSESFENEGVLIHA